jgi:hypothetical protein
MTRTFAERAVACPGWRWLPGMLALRQRPGGADSGRIRLDDATAALVSAGYLPDLDDAATLGALWMLVSTLDPEGQLLCWGPRGWRWAGRRGAGLQVGASKAEALVIALEWLGSAP